MTTNLKPKQQIFLRWRESKKLYFPETRSDLDQLREMGWVGEPSFTSPNIIKSGFSTVGELDLFFYRKGLDVTITCAGGPSK